MLIQICWFLVFNGITSELIKKALYMYPEDWPVSWLFFMSLLFPCCVVVSVPHSLSQYIVCVVGGLADCTDWRIGQFGWFEEKPADWQDEFRFACLQAGWFADG